MALIGTAGWSIPAKYRGDFPADGSNLEKYAARLKAVEINSSFHRPHQRKTYERWAASVPPDFRFAVKVPRSISHDNRLMDYRDNLKRFFEETSGLGGKRSVFLVQLPPSLPFDLAVAGRFFRALAKAGAKIACEPRHASWFTPQADVALKKLEVARVAADPPRAPGDGAPGGWRGFAYWRLHGSPRVYYSSYSDQALEGLATKLKRRDWCMFDNTMSYAAMGNALALGALTAA